MAIQYLRHQVIHIADELKNSHGDDYSEQVCKAYFELLDIYPADKISTLQIIINAFYDTIDYDNKDKVIASLQKKMKEQDARICKLEEENKQKDIRIGNLEKECKELKNQVNMLMRNQYLITLAEAIKKVQRYIIQTATGYDSQKMDKVNLNLDEFIALPENEIYKPQIEELMATFEISKYNNAISKVINKRNGISHPDPVEMDMLELACNTMKATYPGIDALYNHYQVVYDYFN
jgi:hypothetical protein